VALRGVFSPLATPFDGEGVDAAALTKHVELVREGSPHGVVVAGSGGEFPAMTIDERRLVTETVAEAIDGSLPMIVCVATYATRDAVRLARHAEMNGAAAILVSAPYFVRPPAARVREHLQTVRAATGLPMMLYQTPDATGVDFTLGEIEALVEDGVLQAIKMSFPGANRLRDMKATIGDRAAVFCGHDGSALECLIGGADGWISCVPICFPALAVDLWDAVARRDPLDALTETWHALLPFVRFMYEPDGKVAGEPHWLEATKTALVLLGHPVGPPRAPLRALAGEDLAALELIVRRLEAAVTALA
jgi:4-hydroxy-tetrahydrodipicolinate synthase